jgi:hypothetical protein
VGASAPNPIRPSAVSVTSPAATHLPVLRQRPSGTNVYKIATSSAANRVTWSDGIPQPPQLASMTTPNGRGRWAIGGTQAWATRVSSCARTSTTISCRNRRSASSSPTSSPLRTHQELMAASTRQAPTSPGAWSPTSHRTTASSTTVTSIARPRSPPAKTLIVRAISTTPAINHRTPLVCR